MAWGVLVVDHLDLLIAFDEPLEVKLSTLRPTLRRRGEEECGRVASAARFVSEHQLAPQLLKHSICCIRRQDALGLPLGCLMGDRRWRCRNSNEHLRRRGPSARPPRDPWRGGQRLQRRRARLARHAAPTTRDPGDDRPQIAAEMCFTDVVAAKGSRPTAPAPRALVEGLKIEAHYLIVKDKTWSMGLV